MGVAVSTQTTPETAAKSRRFPVDYPDSDGKPMAETDKHRDLGFDFIAALKLYFWKRPDVYISGNNFIYYLEGDRNAKIAPDCYVVFGVPMRQRNSYKAWEEGGYLPDVVFEFTSRSTRREDHVLKGPLYEQVLKVSEYFLFDPTGDYLKPRLQGYRLLNGQYYPLELTDNRLYSERLGLWIVVDGEVARLYDAKEEKFLPTYDEQVEQLVQEAQRAEFERLRATQEAQRADEEAKARALAETENQKLREEVEALRRQKATASE